ncbi:MAG: diguanylate cyclase [Ghiorsea sp.]
MRKHSSDIMIVFVDDQSFVIEAVRRMFEDEPDIHLHFCLDASEALETILSIRPTLILQDLMMPEIDGITLLKTYRSHPDIEDIPIIVLSAKEEPKVKANAFAVGANDYIVKLPDKVELIARIRYHAQWSIHKMQRDAAFKSLRESQRQLEALNLKLHQQTVVDGLTNIMNRRGFDEAYANEWRRAQREKTPLALIMTDIDSFKLYNDNMGHLAGDDCLKAVASMLKEILKRPSDLVARYGGEEFIIMLSNTDVAGASLVAEKIRGEIEAAQLRYTASDGEGIITISAGVVAVIPSTEQSPDYLIEMADQAMYQAKKNGKNQVNIHQDNGEDE